MERCQKVPRFDFQSQFSVSKIIRIFLNLFFIAEPKTARTKKGTNQKEYEPKTAQTKKGTNQKQHEPKTARTKNSTNQKGHKPKSDYLWKINIFQP